MLLSHGGESSSTAAPAARWTTEQVWEKAPDEASREAGNTLAASGSWSGGGKTKVGGTEGGGTRDGGTGDGGTETRREGSGAGGVRASGPADPEAARRRAGRRAERITGGAQELEQRLADLLRGGLATADQPGYGMWEETAARMVDAQAPGLAGRVRDLAALPASGPGWPVRLLEECALLHLLDSAWLGIDGLPEPLAATVRTRVGLTAPAGGPPVRDQWQVLAQYDTPDGRIVTRRIWLYGQGSGRTALVLSFGAAGHSPGQTLPVGSRIDAEITPYPGAGQLRAELGQLFGAPSSAGTPPPGGTTTEAVRAYGDALRHDPWLDSWPVTLRDVIPVPSGNGWQLVDAVGDTALPLAPSATARPGLWRLLALSGGFPVTVFGTCGHRGFDPLAAWATETDVAAGATAKPAAGANRDQDADADRADDRGIGNGRARQDRPERESGESGPGRAVPAAETVPLI
ncbi:SWIM zinc finger family protein [Streptomyces sp. NPDC014734]|uniref:SWIM zinc finger family protein n=1 Tax=Streptomyces sp. NPDC014734 TaxID=3364886 RepID=UPI0036F542F2